ncbi:hypothetical protein [Gordonia liuliyuniae]|uniref:Uncharacterized protein n=1 Tax=Gordonia liuliyuniae TaxID=2911517 RepID=A0ABS9IPI0_9ACTN|nr:hypothetical protein [Gordonia liuliyuniae]MCF8587463.1 hypothetical protein [Gordonia liuliyuniae]
MKKSAIRRGMMAAAAAAAVAAGSLAPAPATAAEPSLEVPICSPGEGPIDNPVLGGSVDCTAASASLIAQGADALIALVAPDLGLKLSDLNKAFAIGVLGILTGDATISGDGFTTAVGATGTAHAKADGVVSGAIAIGSLDGVGDAESTFGGVSFAAGGGSTTSSAHALPLGIATSVGFGYDTAATALGGFASAAGTSPLLAGQSSASTVCTALYGTASVSDGGDNLSSCTSVLFIFQQSQQGDGPVVYAVKNPFALTLTSPLAELLPVIGMAEQLGLELPFPKAVTDLLGVGFVPTFTDDLIRIVMSDDGPKIETDLFGSKDAATTATPTALAAKHTSPQASDDDAVAADAVTAGDVTAGAPAESEDAIEVEGPAAEAPVAEAEAETAPEETETETPAAEAEAEAAPEETEAEAAPAETEAEPAPSADEQAAADEGVAPTAA